MPQRLHIGIAGAGLLGRLLAWRLARAGHAVSVFDPAEDPQRPETAPAAGWTAAGLLSPLAELESGDAGLARLGWRSLELWPQWLAELPKEVPFCRDGSLLVAHAADAATAQRLLTRIAARNDVLTRQPLALSTGHLRELEPVLAPGLHGWLLPGEGMIHSVLAMQALAEAGSRLGVTWHWGRSVERVSPGRLDDERFDLAIDTRGVGARLDLSGLRGVRGEIFWLQASGLSLRHPLRLLHPRHRVYLVPRPGDIVVVGASEIESEDRSPVSLRSTLELLSAAHSVLPELAEARVVHSETNLRPALPDNLPLLQCEPRLLRINGLFRHGWLVAPALVEHAMETLHA
jgi:glycine oxidase